MCIASTCLVVATFLVRPGFSQEQATFSLPKGTYVAAQYTCEKYIEAGLLSYDGEGFSPSKSTCRLVPNSNRGTSYDEICHENDSPETSEKVSLDIRQIDKKTVSINGVTYKFCPGL